MMTTKISELPLLAPGTKAPRRQPLKAWHHFQNLIADKEDTAEVFHIVEALAGSAFVRNATNFKNSPNAQEIMDRNIYLPDMLDDHDALRKLPADSLGQAYVRFMEQEGLTAAGLVAEYDRYGEGHLRRNDLTEWYGDRMRDTHDLFHVLTGYGRDALGEQCVLAFTYSQNPNLGILFIAYAGGLEIKKGASKNIPVFSAIRQAQKMGKTAKRIPYELIEDLLAMPLTEARDYLGIGEPTLYNKAHELFRGQGIDPYDLLGQNVAAA